MKRLMTLILAVCFLICGVTAANADVTAAGEETASGTTKEIELLKTLEIFDTDVDAQKEVTRAEFAGYMARIMNVEEYNRQDRLYFVDVPSTYWKSNSINGLAEIGVISGDGTSKFRPDDLITISETASILLKAMGYDKLAEIRGGYPNGYMDVFNSLELDDGLSLSGGTLTNENVARILYNSFDTPMYKISGSNGNAITMESDESLTFLYEYRGISCGKGKVTGIYGLSLNDEEAPEKGRVRIDGETYEVDDAYIRAFLGRDIEIWYEDIRDENRKRIVFVYETKDSDILTVKAEDIIEFDSDSYTLRYYNASGARRTARINIDAEFIANGSKYMSSLSQSMTELEFGQVTLYNTDNSSGYDAVICEDYEICVASSYDSNKNVIYGEGIDEKQIDVDEYSTVIVFLDSGEIADVSDIRENDVLTVIRSDDYLEIYICRETVTGVVEAVNQDAVTIDGVEYPLNSYVTEKYGLVFNLSSNVIARFNHSGTIVACDTDGEESMDYAYIRLAYRDEGDDLFFKLYLFSNEFVTLEPADKVIVDGSSCKEANLEQAVFGSDVSHPMLIRYSVNDEGEISEIDTPKKSDRESEETLICNQDFANLTYNGSGRVGTKTVLSNDGTKVLAVPTDDKVNSAALRDFELGTPRTMLLGDVSYEIATYTIGENKGAEDIAVIKRNLEYRVDYLSALVLVGNTYEGLNSDDDVVQVIEGMQGTNPVTYYLDPSVCPDGVTVNEGDILHVETDSVNNIRSMEMLYKYTEEDHGNPTPQWGGPMYGNFNDNFRLSWGYIISVQDRIIKWGYTSPDTVDEAYYWTQPVVFYDGTKAWSGSLDEITTADMNPVSPDRIIVKAKYGTISYIFVYKDPV